MESLTCTNHCIEPERAEVLVQAQLRHRQQDEMQEEAQGDAAALRGGQLAPAGIAAAGNRALRLG